MDSPMHDLYHIEDAVLTLDPIRVVGQPPMHESTKSSNRIFSPQRRPIYSPGGTYISRPPQRLGVLRNLLVDSPSRPSYQRQMSKHWVSPQTCRPRSASPRRTPNKIDMRSIVPAKGAKTNRRYDSTSPSSEGGVALPGSPTNIIENGFDGAYDSVMDTSEPDSGTIQAGAPLPPDNFAPLHDLEAAVAQCFDSPSPSVKERRKTLHISTPVRQQPQDVRMGPSSSSSEDWTGDEIFVPKLLVSEREKAGVKQMRAPPVKHHVAKCVAGTTCSRSPLRHRQDSTRTTPGKSRFRVMASIAPIVMHDSQSVRSPSDADDEDEGSETSSGVSE